MPQIQLLSPSVVNKIAAGEVIERPASVVKELMENALDAGATRVDVSIEKGGTQLVRVADDGCGIDAAQLELAVSPHATSKIQDADDLFRVGTLGFRGEALASIAEVSKFVLRSRPQGGEAGAELIVSGGRREPIVPCGCPVGTIVEVRDLFYNVPVRRKFLRSVQTEMGHVSEAFTRLALAFPERHFTLQHNGRMLYELPPGEPWVQRIGRFFGTDLAEQLIAVESADGDIRLRGYVAHPSQSRANQRMQYLFLNGRAIRDRSLQHALGEAYRGLLLTGRYPIAFLCLDVPPESVDVNVHPTKLEVRFQDGGRLYSQLLGTLRTKFLSTDLSSRFEAPDDDDDPAAAHDGRRADELRQELVTWAKGELERRDGGHAAARGGEEPAAERDPAVPASARQTRFSLHDRPPRQPLDLTRLSRSWQPTGEDEERLPGVDDVDTEGPSPGALGREASAATLAGGGVAALQVHNRYLVTESDEGVVVIDQHALHERILYEQLREKVLAGALETQTLLVPEPVDLTPAEAAAVLDGRNLLEQLGIRIEPFGGDTVLVSSYPAMLANMNPAEVLRGMIEHLLAGGKEPDRRDLLDELLHMISCKAAIKAGDRLTPEEIGALLEQRHLVQDTHHCPHGRPTALVFTREELDKQFKRT